MATPSANDSPPAHPERPCWGGECWCVAGDSACGNGPERSPHPVKLSGLDWQDFVPRSPLSSG
ncbi:MAG: DUF3079 domain-containing protein [Comamonas sp.]